MCNQLPWLTLDGKMVKNLFWFFQPKWIQVSATAHKSWLNRVTNDASWKPTTTGTFIWTGLYFKELLVYHRLCANVHVSSEHWLVFFNFPKLQLSSLNFSLLLLLFFSLENCYLMYSVDSSNLKVVLYVTKNHFKMLILNNTTSLICTLFCMLFFYSAYQREPN